MACKACVMTKIQKLIKYTLPSYWLTTFTDEWFDKAIKIMNEKCDKCQPAISKQALINFLVENGYLKNDKFEKIEKLSRGGHGSCCYCESCWQFNDDCVCEHNRWVDFIGGIL